MRRAQKWVATVNHLDSLSSVLSCGQTHRKEILSAYMYIYIYIYMIVKI